MQWLHLSKRICLGVQTPGRFDDFDAITPTSSNYNPLDGQLTYEDDLSFQCTCRMQIEEEEDKLFAHALAVSYVQDGLPLVPHLSFTDEEHDIVRCQNEASIFSFSLCHLEEAIEKQKLL